MKRTFSVFLIVLMIAVVPCQDALAFSLLKKDFHNLDGNFKTVYPEPFMKTKTGMIMIYVGSAILVGAITYCTAGTGTAAAAGPIATWVGSALGSLHGLGGIAAVNWGLAMLGGGAISSGGLGVLGGITILNMIGDVALAVALDKSLEKLPHSSSEHDFMRVIKVKMLFDHTNPEVGKIQKEIKRVLKDETMINGAQGLISDLEDALLSLSAGEVTKTTGYDLLQLAIIKFNNNDFEGAQDYLNRARGFFNSSKTGTLDYLQALIHLSNGSDSIAEGVLNKAVEKDPEAIPPYVVLAQIYHDNGDHGMAISTLKRALEMTDDKDFSLNWMAANFLYEKELYGEAIDFFENALGSVSLDQLEALCKLGIAKCYSKMDRYKEAEKWHKAAVKEVGKNVYLKDEIEKEYNRL